MTFELWRGGGTGDGGVLSPLRVPLGANPGRASLDFRRVPCRIARSMRPPLLHLLGAVAVAVAGCLAPGARADLIYVLNSGEASISVLDAETREETLRIPVLREPHHLVLTPDGQSLIVADSGGNELLFLDPPTGAVQKRLRISNPYHLDFSPDGKWLVVAGLRRDQIDLYDAATMTLVKRHRLPDKPSHIAFSPYSLRAYVTLQGNRSLAAIDLATQEIAWVAEVGPEPAGVLWHRGKLLVGIMGLDHIAVVDPDSRLVERTIPIGRGAHTVFAAPDGRALWATSRVDSRLTELDPDTLAVRRVIEMPGGPDCLAFAPDGRIWMTLRWAAKVAVLDPATGAFETMRVGRSPHGIFVQPRPPAPAMQAAR
jgi:YVTN family beta-propeller protein